MCCVQRVREDGFVCFSEKKKKKGEGRWTWWRLGCLNDGGRREDQIVIGFFSFISYSLLLPLALSFVSVFRCSEIPFLYVSS
jgi:hypothetical protein